MATKKPSSGFVQDDYAVPKIPDYVIAELRYDSSVVIATGGKFAAAEAVAPKADALNKLLGAFSVKRCASHFALPEKKLAARAKAVTAPDAKVTADFAHAGFVQILLDKAADAVKLAERLAKSDAVWQAYVAPRPVPAAMAEGSAAGSRNFEPAQGYLDSAPDGIGAMAVWSSPGGKGKGVTVCDIEGNWNLTHEDLPSGISLIGGTPIAQLSWRNHGTAVLGEIVSSPGDVGTVGIAHEAKAKVHSAVVGGVFNAAGAITAAAAVLKKGDVILIELQATGPTGNYIAMQYWNDVFSAIRAATAKGITVVEAAGNGNENFDQKVFAKTGLQKDSGAIVVGAGVPPTNFFDHFGFGSAFAGYSKIGVPRSRIWFSNYGKIVNVQGWGWHVTTLGYGNAQGGASENTWYTHRFSGTSSASPIVTGAVACVQGLAKAKKGAPLTPAQVRNLLMATGTAQVAGPGVPVSQHIGPLPNLAAALKKI
jgi:subtilisin family serine protease